MPEIRPFRRSDRDQVTSLVNAHIEAVLPGVTVSPNAVLSQLEREPHETVVDPWVVHRETWVAEEHGRIAGAAHLVRYGTGTSVGPDLRGRGDVRWFLHWPGGTADAVGSALLAAAVGSLRRQGVSGIGADVGLPAPAAYGVSDRWPHVGAALERAGFVPGDRVEVVLAAAVDDLPDGGPPLLPGLSLRGGMGGHAHRYSAVLDGRVVGFHEVSGDLTEGGTKSRLAGWADGWELWVHRDLRRRGVATWLLGHAADRLRSGGARRVLDYAVAAPEADVEPGVLPFLLARGYRELSRTRRGWRLP